MGVIKLAIKVGLATAAVYYVREQGIWRESQESLKTYNNIKTAVNPYIQDVKQQIPFELPHIPETDNLWQSTKQYWNKGIQSTFIHLSNSPDYIKEWTQAGINAAKSNEEIKKFVDSFSKPPQSVK